jgi:quercetin dioxygenase-like cupin family protein
MPVIDGRASGVLSQAKEIVLSRCVEAARAYVLKKVSSSASELIVPGAQRLAAPAHSHDHYEETIYGIQGVSTWTVEGKQIDVGPGQALCIPRGAIHRFDNNGIDDVKALCVITPAALGPQYFRESAEVINATAVVRPTEQSWRKSCVVTASPRLRAQKVSRVNRLGKTSGMFAALAVVFGVKITFTTGWAGGLGGRSCGHYQNSGCPVPLRRAEPELPARGGCDVFTTKSNSTRSIAARPCKNARIGTLSGDGARKDCLNVGHSPRYSGVTDRFFNGLARNW